ncbi:suppressor of fused domain protein [Streptomyces sp. NPDC006172]|uniref:suppressor of fused domain protein n=1 Tax=Streptomyces sp. NPDC006172 TaxID=3154470 RepID=UPI0033CCFE9C
MMAVRDTLDRFDRYCELLSALTGVEPVISDVEPRVRGDGPVRAISYIGTPEPGYVTGFTYGLSLSSHPDWGTKGRELCVTVRSGDVEWSQVPARVVAALRGICPFNPGQVLGYKEPYVADSSMNSIVLAEPAVELGSGPLNLGDIEGGARMLDLVEVVGAYPIHSSEREFAYSHGFDALWSLAWDRFDPARAPVA